MTNIKYLILSIFLVAILNSCEEARQGLEIVNKPNVILVITDDQGYGDIAAHGNPYVKTPHVDAFHSESLRLTDFHVSPTCSPSRAALMTGRYTNRTGAWHTIAGWSLLREEERTLANMFSEAGYITGAFGKWHLGDNYPFRVYDRGFQESVVHGGGGVQQTPDYWGNDYFGDTYFENGAPKKYEGYCTDVFFNEATKFIEKNKEQPFFCYIATNAPHWPYNVPEKYADMYQHISDDVLLPRQKQFLGMLTNIDDNFGALRKKLTDLNIADNTILVYMADNGSAAGYVQMERNVSTSPYLGFNANMRGTKNSAYEGGHRVPFFIYWKDGNIYGGKDLNQLTAHIDVMPSLASLCGIGLPKDHQKIDGKDFSPLLVGKQVDWEDRVIVTDSQREQSIARWRKTAVMQNKWRLVNGEELYDISMDPAQTNNLSAEQPELFNSLKSSYDLWWTDISEGSEEEMFIKIGTEHENPVTLTTHDWHAGNSQQKWNQLQIRDGGQGNGYWSIEIMEDANYEVSMRRYPIEADLSLNATVPGYDSSSEPGMYTPVPESKALQFVKAKIVVDDQLIDERQISPSDKDAKFKVSLKKGRIKFSTIFTDETGEDHGAYYTYVDKVE